MLRSLCILLLAVLSWNHHVNCVDTDVAHTMAYNDGGFARNWRVKGRNTVLKWQKKFNPHKQFFYLTYVPNNYYFDDYCEITQVSTESPESETLTCRYKFKADEKDVQIYNVIVPNKAEKNDTIEFSYSSANSRAKNNWHIAPMNFTKCREDNLRKSEGNAATAPTANDSEKDVKTMTGEVEDEVPLANITSANLTSEANNKKSTCLLNDDRTEITCTQLDADGKKLLDAVKYDLPRHWQADWFRIHNLKANGAVLLVFGDCLDGACRDMSEVRLGSKGDEHGRIVTRINLECSEVEANLSFDIAEIAEGLCYHIVCSENHYKRNSEVKIESELQYRRFCVYGDLYNN